MAMCWQRMFIFIGLLLAACNLAAEAPAATSNPQALATPSQTNLSCGEIVSTAVETVGDACGNLGRNQICYGHRQLETDLQSNISTPFRNTGDTANLTDITRLDASPLDEANQTWGIALLRAQVNLADTLPGQNVTFLLIGDTDLPHLTSNMQAFTVSTGLNTSTCADAPPSAMLIQSPDQTQVTMTINGATITLGSTIYVLAVANNELTIATLEGTAIVQAFGVSRIVQPGGQVRLPLGLDNGLLVNGPPSEPEAYDNAIMRRLPLSLLDRQFSLVPPIGVLPAVATATNIPLNIAPPTALTTACVLRDDWTSRYTIQSGDTLFRIATQFDLAVSELQSGNCIEDANIISVGQELRVPFTATPTPIASPLPVASATPTAANFRADERVLKPGECTTVRWDVDNIESVFFQNNPTTGHDSQSVCPSQTTTYTLLVINPDGQQTRYTVTIDVNIPTASPTINPRQQNTS